MHKGDFLGLKTSMRWLIFYSVQSGSVCNSPILSGNTIYTGILIIWLVVFYLVHFVSTYVTYWVLYSCLCLHCTWYCRYLRWGKGVNFLTTTSVYEYFDAVVFWLEILYSFFTVHFGCECMRGPLSMRYVYIHTILYVNI